jgi:hypothetical protein
MGQYNIPKLSRNKFNFVKGADTDNFITQSQMMAASGGSGSNINSNTISQNAQLSSAIKMAIQEMLDDGELISASEAEQMMDTKISEYDDSKSGGEETPNE